MNSAATLRQQLINCRFTESPLRLRMMIMLYTPITIQK